MPRRRPLDTINDALENPEITDEFRKFLKSEFSDENLEFHERVAKFNKDAQDPSVSDQQIKAGAKEIYDRFLSKSAPRQVNVSFDTQKNFEGMMKGINGASRDQIGSMLHQADGEIVKLMARDSLKRFQKTDGFKEGRQEANDYLDKVAALQKLETRERQLKLDPSLGDKAKAMVTSGGKVTMIREVERQKEALQQQINARVITPPTYGDGSGHQGFAVAAPTRTVTPTRPQQAPLEPAPGIVGRARSNASDGMSRPPKATVREVLENESEASKVGRKKSVSVSKSKEDPSKMTVREKVKLFEEGGPKASPPKHRVK